MAFAGKGYGRLPDKLLLTSFLAITVILIADGAIDILPFTATKHGSHSNPINFHDTIQHIAFLSSIFLFMLFIWRRNRANERLEQALTLALNRAEEEKARAELEKNRTEAVVAAIGDGISVQDRDFRILYTNDKLKNIAAADYTGSICHEVYEELKEPCPGCPLLMAFQDGGIHKHEKSVKHSKGTVTHIEITASPLRNAQGEIIGGVEVVRDITLRKQQEEALKMHASFLQRLIDTIPNPIFYKDAAGIYLGCNTAYESVIGRPRAEVIGKTISDLLSAEEAALFLERDAELLGRPGTQFYAATITFSDGLRHDIITSKATFNDNEGNVAGFVGTVNDITELMHREDEVINLNHELTATVKELEAFSFSLSHDLRNPLTRISMASQELAENSSGNLNETEMYFVRTILDACLNMEELIEAMLVLGRVSRQELNIELINLSEIVEEISATLQMNEPARRIEPAIEQGVTGLGDRYLLRIVLENLVGNAWKYSSHKAVACIEFGRCETEQGPAFYVRDNGAGFDMSKADKLFKPFQRLHSSSDFPGTGIGLATVQRIIQRHGGEVWGEGAPDHGAVFYFTLRKS